MRRARGAYALPVGAVVVCRIFVDPNDPAQLPRNRWTEAKVVDVGGLHQDDMTIVQGPDGRTHYKALHHMWMRVDAANTRASYKRADMAATQLNRAGHWWWDKEGAPERVATTLEVALYASGIVIAPGYRLATVDNEELPLPAPETVWRAPITFTDTEAERLAKKQAAKHAEQSAALEHAREKLAQAARKAKRWNTAQRRWARRVKALERNQ